MSYWIFKANPKRFRIEARLKDPQPKTTWLVTRYSDQVKPGDIAFIWSAGRPPGIVAVMRVDSFPEERDDLNSERSYWVDSRDAQPRLRVQGTFTHRGLQLPSTRLKGVRGLEELSVFRGWQQATNFRVTDQEAAILMRLIENEHQAP